MSIEIYHGRLRKAIKDKIAENHRSMDKGVPLDQYMKLVGRNAALTDLLDTMKSVIKDLGAEIDEDIEE